MVRWCFLALLLLFQMAPGAADFDDHRHEYEFIYHDSYDLMLIVKGNDCYFAEFKEDVASELQGDLKRNHTQDALITIIENGHGHIPHGHDLTVLPSNLSYVRIKYQDLLADYHCFGKDVYTLEKPAANAACKTGWTKFQDSCYVILSELVPWTSAKIMCEALGGGLLEIHSKEENDFITQLAKDNGTGYLWLGLTDMAHEGNWAWVSNGQAPDYTNWMTGAPNNLHNHESGEDCAFLRVPQSGHWGDYYCELYPENATFHIGAACEARPSV